MNIIDFLGALFIRVCSIFKKTNNKKHAKLFLYKRNLTLASFVDGRIFIKHDDNGKNFISEVLKSEFSEYKISKPTMVDKIIANSHEPKNEYIAHVWYNDAFQFEFIEEKHWDHLLYTITLADKFNLPIALDSMFVHSINSIEDFK